MATTLSFNKVILVGRLTSDPEFSTFSSGKKKVSIRIASNIWDKKEEKKKEKNEENKNNSTLFITCEAWDEEAVKISNWFKKGRPILVEGHLFNNDWTDKHGTKHYEIKVNIKKWEFMDSTGDKKKSGNNGHEDVSDLIPESAGNCSDDEVTPEDFDAIVEKVLHKND